MRLTALALAAVLAAGCGGDEPEEIPQTPPQPAPRQPVDTTLGDTVAVTDRDTAAAPAEAQRPGGTSGQERVVGERLYTVQVAAFTESSSASEWEGRLKRQGLPVWTSMAELGGRTFYRLRVGAVPTVAEARRLGAMLSEKYEWPVWVAPLTPGDRIPTTAVEDTRRVLKGS